MVLKDVSFFDICTCGHDLRFHVNHTDIGYGKYCVGKLNPDCKCMEFILDNLTYIERIAKERKLV